MAAATRRLAAILAADVAGYSRLMGVDEERTLERLRAIRLELVHPSSAAHNGRIVKTMGDGFLAVFASTVDALRCALEIQTSLRERNAGLRPQSRIDFRIGIHQGDIVAEDGDIFGDGVNVAARLEALAEPGGICVSARVQEDAAGKLDLAFRDLGEQELKNIARPIRVYAVGGLPLPPPKSDPRTGAARTIGLALAAAAIAVGLATWWLWPPREAPPNLAEIVAAKQASIVSETKPAPRLSIIALPFTNLTNDPDQQYLADGITEDLTTDLSRLPGMQVISRNSAFAYAGKHIDTKQIGRELNVRYVLEGSVQRSGNRVRVNAQLIDAENDRHLWAERFDRDLNDVFELQNDVTGRIAVSLNLELLAAEAARPIGHPDALDYVLRARAAQSRGPPTKQSYVEAIDFAERAVSADPSSIDAQAWLANLLTGRVLDGFSPAPAEDIKRAEALLATVLATTPRRPFFHYIKAQILRAVAQGGWGAFNLNVEARTARFAEAIPEYELVIAANPNDASALSHLAWCKFMTGSPVEAVPLLEKSIRLSPRDPFLYLRQQRLGTVYLFQGRTDDAIEQLESARRANSSFLPTRPALTAAYGLKGDTARAATELAETKEGLKRRGIDSYQTLEMTRQNSDWNTPPLHEAFEKYFIAGLRLAGWPDQ